MEGFVAKIHKSERDLIIGDSHLPNTYVVDKWYAEIC